MSRLDVLFIGIFTRTVLFILQIFISNLIPDWSDPDICYPPLNLQNKTCDNIAGLLLDGYYKWDVAHMLTVSRYGYVYEKELAFFPLYPLTIRFVANNLPTFGLLSEHYIHLLCGLIINFILFLFSLDRLYLLTSRLFNEKIASLTVVLFCVSPATIHMTVPYSEILYFSLTLHGLYLLETRHSSSTVASLLFGLSAVTRSNGLLNFGFIIYHTMWPAIKKFNRSLRVVPLIKAFIGTAVNFVIFLTPFVIHMSYAYETFCRGEWKPTDFPNHMVEYSKSSPRGECRLPGDGKPPWCSYRIPISYNYIQSHYWRVGFLHYFEISKTFCFLMAGPVITLTISAVRDYYRDNKRYCWTLGLGKDGDGNNVRMFVYAVHVGVSLAMFLPFIHVEVLTRLLFNCSPYLYWYAARLVPDLNCPPGPIDTAMALIQRHQQVPVLKYFVLYTIIGTGAFVNGLPWT